MMRLADPWALWLLVLVPLLWWQPRPWRAAPIAFSAAWWARAAGASLRQRLLFLTPLLRTIAFALLVLAVARPQWGVGEARTLVQGIAIMGVLDRSSSMRELMQTRQGRRERFEIAQHVFRSFALGDGTPELPGRPHDLIGLVTFGRFAESICPLVRDHETLASFVSQTRAVTPQSPEDGTAIGDALALAAARLDRAERDLLERERSTRDRSAANPEGDGETGNDAAGALADYRIKSKCIILLTDGAENAGTITAMEAAELCRELGIRVYVIALGQPETSDLPRDSIFTMLARQSYFRPELLRPIAETTGGRFWFATDGETLHRIYAEIDRLERSEIRVLEYTNYQERFMLPAMIGLAALAAEFLLARTLLRREA
jgi:Ca-activated chloride channel family protein